MTSRSVLSGGRRRRHGPPPALLGAALVALAFLAVALTRDEPADRAARPPVHESVASLPATTLPGTAKGPAPLAGGGTAPSPLAVRLDVAGDPVRVHFRHPPRSGLLFDIDTGRVLWRRAPTRVLPIASLTKMMTALLVAERVPRRSRVLVTKEALHYRGSGVGLLPRGRRIPVETMLHGLLLPSGNDAAIALAQRVAGGSVARFVGMMNRRARAMGLLCTRFSRPDGYQDRGNHSCAGDLAELARAVLRVPRLARIVRRRSAILPFPIKGGKLYLYNNNPLLRASYRGTTGLKTGYTEAAGLCLVATARRHGRRLGVVLLHSPDPYRQAVRLLDRGWRTRRRV
jgi:D-alanyl-D-alanine carboxypeptidase (penicillin-binding protein 5/6)